LELIVQIEAVPGFDAVRPIKFSNFNTKWIALSGIHGVENYINYTRTGFPVIPKSINGFNLQASRPKDLYTRYQSIMQTLLTCLF
jgi:hypothetical protein